MQEIYSGATGACRLCLSESEFQLLIFGDTGQKLGIHFKIQSCFPSLQVTEHDGLPDSICYRCLFSLEQTYDFWTKCCTTEAILSKSHLQKKHQVIPEQKIINYQPKEATFPYTADDSDWDEWFIWDATYKISQSENQYSKQMPITHHSNNQGKNPNLMFQSGGYEDTSQQHMRKKNNSLFKYDFLQEDVPWINENKVMMETVDSHP
ncbi:Uncharacterized protein GBIM_03058 [Gryllus bimaculatus]|nr:Uncharacterized protein GBIM_03058 [Gryllus bimaculatus]